jgi:DNA-binding winged helix-turn-helix (wHTH) protein/Tol biopolymer transport system component
MPSRRFIYPRLTCSAASTCQLSSPVAAEIGKFVTVLLYSAKLRSRWCGGEGVAVSPAEDVIRFGVFELDLKGGQLTRYGTKLRLPQQPLQLLGVLLERPGEIFTRDELRSRLWSSDVFVDFDHGLNKSIQKLRDALGDSASSPRYIETIPRVGYRFIAPVSNGHLPAPPKSAIEPSPQLPDVATESPAEVVAGGHKARWWIATAAAVVLCAAIGVAVYVSSRRSAAVTYTQLTDFTDATSDPALSPDGHILAFIRGDSYFVSADPIYVKMLPNGEARMLTNDPRRKYGLAFSPDGSQIAYTVMGGNVFATYAVSVFGGNPHLLLDNAAGLTWLDPEHWLFSRIRSGLHQGIVTSGVTGDHLREVYYPPHERAMAHYSYASPDRRSALVVEMDGQGAFTLCKLVSLEGDSRARSVGPKGECTSGGWSPDGAWMYFIALVQGQRHLWRERFPYGQPQQLTFGPTEEHGLAVERDGHSIITSIGARVSAIWIHDASGERSMSSEGEIIAGLTPPVFAADDKTLYYLLRHHPAGAEPELWRMSTDSGESAAVFPGVSMSAFDISPDGKQVVYSTAAPDKKSQLWIAPTDKSWPARLISGADETWPHFGQPGQIVFQRAEGNVNYLERMKLDGSARAKVFPYPILEIIGISPGRKWLTAAVAYPEGNNLLPIVMAIPLNGGKPQRLCKGYCYPVWSSTGNFLFVPVEPSSQTNPGRSLAIPIGPGETLPELPPEGIPPSAQPGVVPGAQSIDRAELVPGKDLSHYAYVKTTSQRNLYRVSLP